MTKATKPKQDDKEKASFYLDKTIQRKLKYISAVDDKFQTDLINEALSTYIEKWEKENGKIKLKEEKA